jgi:hypothetical protein
MPQATAAGRRDQGRAQHLEQPPDHWLHVHGDAVLAQRRPADLASVITQGLVDELEGARQLVSHQPFC